MNGAIQPSLMIIGVVGAHRSGLVTLSRRLVIGTSAPQKWLPIPPTTSDEMAKIGKYAIGFAALAMTAMLLGSGDGGLSDVTGAMLALTAASAFLLDGVEIYHALGISTAPTVTNPYNPGGLTTGTGQ